MKKNCYKIKVQFLRICCVLGLQLCFLSTIALSQSTTVNGSITDEQTSETLPGVNLIVKNTTTGTATNADGEYELVVSSLNDTLVVSYVGYETLEVPINGRTVIDVEMAAQAAFGEDFIVVGYGTQRKETLTGSISAVGGDDMQKAPSLNVTNSLQGRLPGLVAISPTGEPGNDNSMLRIRGGNTLGDNSPLVIIDGISNRDLARIDPSSIESITVLKDASAAIYGSQAANGVILVTTKRGVAGEPQITVNLNQGWSTPSVLPEMADAASYAQMINEIKMYNNEDPAYSQEDIQKYADGSAPWTHPNTDWFDETIKSQSPQRYGNISLGGGSERVNYYSSLGYSYQDGIFKKSATNYSQFNLRTNLDAVVTDYITASLDVAARREDRNYPGSTGLNGFATNNWWALNRAYPYLPAYWPTGEPGPDVEYGTNPVVTTTGATGYVNNKRYVLQTNLKFDIKIPWVENLLFTADANVDKTFDNNKQFTQPWTVYTWDGQTRDENDTPVVVPGSRGVSDARLSQSMFDGTRTTLKGLLNYNTSLGDRNNIGALFGAERVEGDYMNFSAYRRYFTSTAIDQMFAGGDELKDNSGSAGHDARQSFFGRLNYDYDLKYMAEVVFRYDGSYIFPEGNRWGFFPSLSLGWDMAAEDFWKENLSFINHFKLRGSWGQTGNDRVAPYQYMDTYGYSGTYVFNQSEPHNAVNQIRTPNPDITWEVADQKNIGVDGELLNGKFTFSGDYFNNVRSNILWWRNASIPNSTGLSLPQENFAEVANSGFELLLGYNEYLENFRYAISVNGAYSKNVINNWDEPDGAPDHQISTGRPMGSQLYYNATGIFRDQQHVDSYPHMAGARPGDIIFEDVNGDGEINGDDRIRMDKSDLPTFTGGMNIDVGYKGFDASFLIQGAAGAVRAFREFSGEAGNFRMDNVKGRWTPDNPDATKPRAWNRSAEYWMTDGAPNNTYWVRNTDYMRLKSVNIGYSLPQSFTQRVGIGSLRVYASGENLLTLSGIKDFDPESPSNADDRSIWVNSQVYPSNKTVNFGMTLTF
ncbi:MAG: TonB-dependent receptor [Balneolales bacterium]